MDIIKLKKDESSDSNVTLNHKGVYSWFTKRIICVGKSGDNILPLGEVENTLDELTGGKGFEFLFSLRAITNRHFWYIPKSEYMSNFPSTAYLDRPFPFDLRYRLSLLFKTSKVNSEIITLESDSWNAIYGFLVKYENLHLVNKYLDKMRYYALNYTDVPTSVVGVEVELWGKQYIMFVLLDIVNYTKAVNGSWSNIIFKRS